MESEKCAKCKYGEIILIDQFGIYIGCSKVKGKWVVEIEECNDYKEDAKSIRRNRLKR